jgi:hypothetical protein
MPSAALHSPHQSKLLESLYFQGMSNDCGPYTTATVLKAIRGLELNPAELARRMEKPVWRGPIFVVRRVPNWATFPWGIADVLREHGLNARWRFFTSPDEVFANLERGDIVMPVIGSWRPVWAHVMTLVVWEPQEGWGFANTQYNHQNVHWVPEEVFQRQWRAMGRLVIFAQ